MRKPTEYEIEQSILLGGQISQLHTEFKEWAMMDPDTAFIVYLLKKEAEPDKDDIELLETIGKLEFLRGTSELSKLSMILGDTRASHDMGVAINQLRTARSNP